MPFLSVIVPVYKVEDYLKQCVNSILDQDYKDIEIILVDDGSPDRCPLICDEYAKENSNIKVIHKQNGGLSSARNAGIDVASGEYLMFVDSDDWWNDKVSLAELIDVTAKKEISDVVLFGSLDYVPNIGYTKRRDISFLKEKQGLISKEEYYKAAISCGNLRESACTKIMKKSFILENGLYFKHGITGEDTEWMFRLLRVLNNLYIVDCVFYVCRCQRPGSITNSISTKNVYDALEVINGSTNFYEQHPNFKNDTVKKCELAHCAYLWFIIVRMCSYFDKEDAKQLYPSIKRYSYLSKYSMSRKSRIASIAYKLFGLSNTSRLLAVYLKLAKKNIIPKRRKITYE